MTLPVDGSVIEMYREMWGPATLQINYVSANKYIFANNDPKIYIVIMNFFVPPKVIWAAYTSGM